MIGIIKDIYSYFTVRSVFRGMRGRTYGGVRVDVSPLGVLYSYVSVPDEQETQLEYDTLAEATREVDEELIYIAGNYSKVLDVVNINSKEYTKTYLVKWIPSFPNFTLANFVVLIITIILIVRGYDYFSGNNIMKILEEWIMRL